MQTIPWWQPQFGKKEYTLLQEVLNSNFPNEGKRTIEFQDRISTLLHVKHTLAVTSATAAIYLSLKAVGIGAGDEVIVPDITFIATANAVEMTGAKAILVDVDPQTLTLDIHSFQNAITSKTKAVIPVHVSGRAADMEMIGKIAKTRGIFIIEDAAEAFMSKHNGKYLGTIGDIGCFSLSPAKTITTGQGGLIVTNNEKLYRNVRELKDQGRRERGTGGNDIHYRVGFNFKFTDLQAAVGLGQLDVAKKRILRLKKTYLLYQKCLSGVKGISLFDFNIQEEESPQWIDAIAIERDKLVAYLKGKNISCRKFWYPLHQQIPYKKTDSNFPVTTKLSPTAVWLPSAFTLSDNDIKKVCEEIKLFYLSPFK